MRGPQVLCGCCWLQVSPREYLETALSPTPGAGPAVEAKNQVRQVTPSARHCSIEQITCYCMSSRAWGRA